MLARLPLERFVFCKPQFDPAGLFVAEEDGQCAGFAHAGMAFCDTEGIVLRTCTLVPWRLSPVVRRAAFVIEAESGAFDRWRLQRGDRLELRA